MIDDYDFGTVETVRMTYEEALERGVEVEVLREDGEMERSMEPQTKKYEYLTRTITIKGTDGCPKRRKLYAKTEAELQRKVDDLKSMYSFKTGDKSITVAEWGDKWLPLYKSHLPKKTQNGYKNRLCHQIYPDIGSMAIVSVRHSDCQAILNKMSKCNKGIVEDTLSTLRQMFRDAEADDILMRNPTSCLKIPHGVYEGQRRPMNKQECIAFDKAIDAHEYGPFMAIMRYCGLRSGEAAALKRKSIDLDGQTIKVSEAVFEDDNNKPVLGGTKADKLRRTKKTSDGISTGTRIVPIPNKLMPYIEKACMGKKSDDLLFTTRDGELLSSQVRRTRWQSFIKVCHIQSGAEVGKWKRVNLATSSFGKELTPHYLRHTYATDLAAANVQEIAINEFLGHVPKGITARYAKFSDVVRKTAIAQINHFYDTGEPLLERTGGTTVPAAVIKPISLKSIPAKINSTVYVELTNMAVKNASTVDVLLSEAVENYVALYDINPLVANADYTLLSESPIPIVINTAEHLQERMSEIASRRGIPLDGLYSTAVELHLAGLNMLA